MTIELVYSGTEEGTLFPRILKSGTVRFLSKDQNYILLETTFISNINEKITRMEQCFDTITIALIG